MGNHVGRMVRTLHISAYAAIYKYFHLGGSNYGIRENQRDYCRADG